MIYDVNGTNVNAVYGFDGTTQTSAYDINGIRVFPDTLKVMTYNVQWFTGINSQQTMQASIIDTNDADVIGLQEVTQTGTVATVGNTVLSDYPYLRLSNHKNYLGMASKLPLSNIVIADFINQDPLDASQYNETRAYMMADITVGGKTITWINTHLCYLTQSVTFLQMAEVLALAETKDYVIITGDFNSNVESTSDTTYVNMFKPFVDAGYNLVNCTAERGFTKTWTSATTATSLSDLTSSLDNIITSGNINIKSVTFDTTKLSYLNGDSIDHIPLMAELVIN